MVAVQIHFFMLINKQGKVRLAKWYSTYSQKERSRTTKEVTSLVLQRAPQVRLSRPQRCASAHRGAAPLLHLKFCSVLHSTVRDTMSRLRSVNRSCPSLPCVLVPVCTGLTAGASTGLKPSCTRRVQLCNFLDWRNLKLVYKRYASLYFLCAVDTTDNELLTLDMIHHFVEVLDKHFANVCELDLVFNFYKAYWLLDEVLLAGAPPAPLRVSRVAGTGKSMADGGERAARGAGEMQEPSKRAAEAIVTQQNNLVEELTRGHPF